MGKKVSIIVPMFNAKNTIKKTLCSIVSQSYYNIEIIVVDDGSTDGSECIVSQYILKDNRIMLYRIENSGVASARNYGMRRATGEYIFFVDSDDTLDDNTIEQLVINNTRFGTDLSASEIVDIDGTSTSRNEYMGHAFVAYDGKKIGENLYYIRMECALGKLFKNSIILNNQIRFPDGFQLCEDFIFVNKYVQCSTSISKSTDAHYIVNNINEESLSKRYMENIDYIVKTEIDIVKESFRIYPSYKDVYYQTNMSIDFQPSIKYVNNLFLLGAPKTDKRRIIYQYLIVEDNIVSFMKEIPANQMPKRKMDWLYYCAFKTKNISIILMLFWVKEKVKRFHNAKFH